MLKEFERIIGYESIKEELELICDVVRNYDKYEQLGVSYPGGILLEGNPGVGKTLLAKCFIEATGLKSFVCRKNKPNGAFVDEIKRIFDEAEKSAPSIVLLDDMDKFANEDLDHKDAEEYVTIQSCIDNVKDKKVLVIATINDRYKIPDSLKRAGRFDKKIYMYMPKGEDAEKIVKHYLSKMPVSEELDVTDVANLLDGSSCAVLETVIKKAGMYAGFSNKTSIEMEDIVKAFLDVKYHINNSDKRITKRTKYSSVHEAGHAVMIEALFPDTVNLVILNNHKDSHNLGGVISRVAELGDIEPFQDEIYDLMISLSGKAAVELKFGNIDVGCYSDMQRAYRVAEIIIDDMCGFGFDTHIIGCGGTAVDDKKDYMIAKLIETYYKKVQKIIVDNQELLNCVANELLEKKVLLRKDIKKIKEQVHVDRSGVHLI